MEGGLYRLCQHFLSILTEWMDVVVLFEEMEDLRRIGHPERQGSWIVSVRLKKRGDIIFENQ